MTAFSSTTDGATLDQKIGPRGRFSLYQASGEVTLRGVEGDRIRIRSRSGRGLSEHFTVETGEDFVELRQHEKLGLGFSIFGSRESAELEIEVPHGAGVKIETQSADISASDLDGTKGFRTASGEVTLTRLAGALDVETVSGDIEIDGLAPVDLKVKSVSGDIEARVPTVKSLDLGTTSGDIRLDAALSGDGPFAMRSISGDATVIGRNGFRVEAESITGDLSSDLPSKRVSMAGRKVLVVGRPGPTLNFRSVSGDFHVAQPRDAAPETVAPSAPAAPAAPEAPTQPTQPAQPTPATQPDQPHGPVAEATEVTADAMDAIDVEAQRMTILKALERGDIDVTEATDRLAALEGTAR
jgi:DUF4097 and DUF4098 domain-containing protein YvlB